LCGQNPSRGARGDCRQSRIAAVCLLEQNQEGEILLRAETSEPPLADARDQCLQLPSADPHIPAEHHKALRLTCGWPSQIQSDRRADVLSPAFQSQPLVVGVADQGELGRNCQCLPRNLQPVGHLPDAADGVREVFRQPRGIPAADCSREGDFGVLYVQLDLVRVQAIPNAP
jgi:hypothetical protein